MDLLQLDNTSDFNKDIIDNIEELSAIKRLIENYKESAAVLENLIAEKLNHMDMGQKTYHVCDYKLTITSGYNYTVDKAAYARLRDTLPAKFNVVQEKLTLSANKTAIREAMKYASPAELHVIAEVVTAAPAKLQIKIVEGEQ